MKHLKSLVPAAAFLLLAGAAFYLYFSAPEKKADFSFALIGEQRTLDPALATALQEARVIRGLFEGLVRLNSRTLAPEPGVARSWTVSEDGLTYVFHLRPSLWSDGTPLTSRDFVYSWKRVLEPTSLSSYDYMLFYLKNGEAYRKGTVKDFSGVGVSAPDDSTLIVTLAQPVPFFLDIAAFETLLPVSRRCVETFGIRWTRPENMVCNGPYVLTSHRLNYKMRLSKNPRYWDAGRAHFAVVDAYTCEGLNTAFNMYETGNVSFIDDFPNLIAEEILKRPDKLVAPYLGTYFYRMNVTKPPFNDNRVRRAFEMCINKEEIVKYVSKGGELPAAGLVPPGIPGYPAVSGNPYSPDSARTLLAQAGYPGGRGFPAVELLYNTSENHKRLAEAAAYMLKKELGVNITPANVEWKVLLGRVDNFEYLFARGSWIGDYTDPNTFLDMFVTNGGNNRTGWSDRSYDSLVALAARTLEPAKRMAILAEAEKILLEKGPIFPVYYFVTKFMVKPDIRGLYPNIRGYYHLADLYRQ